MSDETINLNDWYTAGEALARLEANVGRKLDESTPRQLGRNDLVKNIMVGNRRLYWRADIDAYHVEQRGQKAARSQRLRGLETKRARKSARKPASKKKDGDEQGPLALAV